MYTACDETPSADVEPDISSGASKVPVTFCTTNWLKSVIFLVSVPDAPLVLPVIVSPTWNLPAKLFANACDSVTVGTYYC